MEIENKKVSIPRFYQLFHQTLKKILNEMFKCGEKIETTNSFCFIQSKAFQFIDLDYKFKAFEGFPKDMIKAMENSIPSYSLSDCHRFFGTMEILERDKEDVEYLQTLKSSMDILSSEQLIQYDENNFKTIGQIHFYISYFQSEKESKTFRPFKNLVESFQEDLECPLIHCAISHLYIDEEKRGKGYGTLLLKSLEKHLIECTKELNVKYLFITVYDDSAYTESEQSIYFKNGYRYMDTFHKRLMKKKIEF
jgi:GNAT superfamily N-acetyltransferase